MSNVLKEKVDPHSHINCCYAPANFFINYLPIYVGNYLPPNV